MKGIATDCMTGEDREVDVEYDIVVDDDGEKIFKLIGGVTGHEGFYIDYRYTMIDRIINEGWLACEGTDGKYDKLFIAGEVMREALEPHINMVKKIVVKEIVVSSCSECPHHGYTESNWYCKKMKLGKDTFREIVDIHKIHEDCPLKDYAM